MAGLPSAFNVLAPTVRTDADLRAGSVGDLLEQRRRKDLGDTPAGTGIAPLGQSAAVAFTAQRTTAGLRVHGVYRARSIRSTKAALGRAPVN